MKSILSLFALLLPFLMHAQNEGVIQFKEIVKLEIELPEDSEISREQLEAMMPSEQTAQKWLYFNESASLFSDKSEDPGEHAVEHTMNTNDGEVRIKMVRASGNNKVYHDIKKNKIVDQRSFLGKTFLVQDNAKKYNWKITGTTKEVAGYPCQQATAVDGDNNLEAWFTPAIPISTGPDGYMNLPGMVLEVTSTSEDGEQKLIAQKVNFKTLEKDVISAPSKGKKVTETQYDEIVAQKMKEMSEQNGGGGIRIRMGN